MTKKEALTARKKVAERNYKRHLIRALICLVLTIGACCVLVHDWPNWAQWCFIPIPIGLFVSFLYFAAESYLDAKAIEKADSSFRFLNALEGKYDYDIDLYMNETENCKPKDL